MRVKGWHTPNSHFESFRFPYIIQGRYIKRPCIIKKKTLKTLNKRNLATLRKRRVWVLNRLLVGKRFLHFVFLNCRAILKTLAPHNKKQIENLVWNKNVKSNQVIKACGTNFSFWNGEVLCTFVGKFWLVLYFPIV